MTKKNKNTPLILILSLIYFSLIFFRKIEFQDIIIHCTIIIESLFIIKLFAEFEKAAVKKKWITKKINFYKILLIFGLIFTIFLIGKIVNYTLTYFEKEENHFLTLLLPGVILFNEIFKIIDKWTSKNEIKNSEQ